jgi:hypothetical protein
MLAAALERSGRERDLTEYGATPGGAPYLVETKGLAVTIEACPHAERRRESRRKRGDLDEDAIRAAGVSTGAATG